MPKRDLYSILGVPVEADAETIKNAYRRLAIRVHPDAGNEPDPARFREAHEAYLILSDAARRRSYDIEVGRARPRRISLEEISPRRPISVHDDFQSEAPAIREMLDHIAQNFFLFHNKSGAP